MKNPIPTFNKYILNRVLSRLAGVSQTPFALVRHMGRKSGKAYETPIIVQPAENAFVIALTYGPDVDWYRNVLAAGHCEILWHKQPYQITAIEPMETQAGRDAFFSPARTILKLTGTDHFVQMTAEPNPKTA